jgi:2,3-dihydroxybenzoate decarboxylase
MPDAKVIAIEEHFTSPKLLALRNPPDNPIQRKLNDYGEVRLREMDEAGVDMQVLSENNPAAQNLEPDVAVTMARASNDFLHEMIRGNPARFAGFAALPTPDPKAAADELERAVTKLGLKGAMIMGTTRGQFLDGKPFRPIFERAAKLDVPVYIHPSPVNQAVQDVYFKDYPQLAGAPLGFGLETLTHTFRLIASGVFDEYPALKIIVGHLGEAAPYVLWRADENLKKTPLKLQKVFSDYYRQHFYLTTSGAFSNNALNCAIAEMGIDRIMFSIDWPFIENGPGTSWLKQIPLSETDKTAIAAGNAKRLLKM